MDETIMQIFRAEFKKRGIDSPMVDEAILAAIKVLDTSRDAPPPSVRPVAASDYEANDE